MCAHESCNQASEEEYTKPETVKKFVQHIMQARMDRDEDSKVAHTVSSRNGLCAENDQFFQY